MKVYSTLFIFCLVTFFCCSNDNLSDEKDEDRFPSCEELELIEMEKPGSSKNIGDTIKSVVYNNCSTCNMQAVYTGLIVYSEEDTLAVDIKLGTQWTPENNQSREYQLKVIKDFELADITRVEMPGICDSVILDL